MSGEAEADKEKPIDFSNRNASVTMQFADGDYTFRIAWGEWQKLQESRDCGPQLLATRLHDGTWRAEDIREVIRIGLIGGGMDAGQALRLVRLYVEVQPIMAHLALAQTVIGVGLVGASDEKLGEKQAASPAGSESMTSPTVN